MRQISRLRIGHQAMTLRRRSRRRNGRRVEGRRFIPAGNEGMGRQRLHHRGKPARRHDIVSIDKGEICPACSNRSRIPGMPGSRPFRRTDDAQFRPDGVKPLPPAQRSFACAIARSVVGNNHLKGYSDLLQGESLQLLIQRRFGIPGRNHNRHNWLKQGLFHSTAAKAKTGFLPPKGRRVKQTMGKNCLIEVEHTCSVPVGATTHFTQ